MRLDVLVVFLLLGAAGVYAFGIWGPLAGRSSGVEQICARVDYMDGLFRKIKASGGPSEQLRDEFTSLVGQCRNALSGRAQENE